MKLRDFFFSLHEIFANYDTPTSRLRITATSWSWMCCKKHFAFKSALWWIIILHGYHTINNISFISAKFHDIPMVVTHRGFITRKRFLHAWLPGIPLTKGHKCEIFTFSLSLTRSSCWTRDLIADHFRRHYVNVMSLLWTLGTAVILLYERHMNFCKNNYRLSIHV